MYPKTLPALPAVVCLVALASTAHAQNPVLVRDINTVQTANPSSSPNAFFGSGAFVYFTATSKKTGTELYRSLGQSSTTALVKDINPGPSHSRPGPFFAQGSTVFFGATTAKEGRELWKTDGTAAGTVLVKDITTGAAGQGPGAFGAIGNTVYFILGNSSASITTANAAAASGNPGELWKTDGTAAGTQLVKAISPVQGSGNSSKGSTTEIVTVNNKLVFPADDGKTGTELWVSDGTANGTVLLKDIWPGNDTRGNPASSFPFGFLVVGKLAYFRATSQNEGGELWVTDGTPAGTKLVKDIRGGTSGSFPNALTEFAGAVYFTANDGSTGTELWKSDGTAAGTVQVKDIRSGTSSSSPFYLTVLGNELLFRASDGSTGFELWKTDGTANGTVLVTDIRTGTSSASPANLTVMNKQVYFSANDGSGSELWKSDGTANGTVQVKDINTTTSTASSSPFGMTATPINRLVFRANDGKTGTEVWGSDGTTNGTTQLLDINPFVQGDTGSSSPSVLVDAAGVTYFSANNGSTGNELWKSDGTTAGTVLVKDIRAGSSSSSPRNFTLVGDTVFFTATGSSGNELWKTDGTTNGTVQVKDIRPGTSSSSPFYLVELGGVLYFRANDGSNGTELWKSDGTANGTVMVKDIRTGSSSGSPTRLTRFGNSLLFSANDGSTGNEMWISDGTAAGTKLLKDIDAGSNSSSPSSGRSGANGDQRISNQFLVVGNTAWFTARTVAGGTELYKTDGTAAGTVLVKDIFPGQTSGRGNSSSPFYLEYANGLVFFRANDGKTGTELWASDGTSAGTVLVKDLNPGTGSSGPNSSFPIGMTALGNRVVFRADSATDSELYISDGTAQGTVLVKDLNPAGPSFPSAFTKVGSRFVYFTATDNVAGNEMWRTDGTAAGTVRLFDIHPGDNSSSTFYQTLSNGKLLFRANDGDHGFELWSYDPGATSHPVGEGCSLGGNHPVLSANDPVLGQSLTVVGQGQKGQTQGALVIGLRSAQPPVVLGSGCSLYPDLSILHLLLFPKPDAQGRWSLQFTVPNNGSLAGVGVPMQAAFGPGLTSPLGLDLSRGLLLTIGK